MSGPDPAAERASRAAVRQAARDSYGRLVAYLSARSRDLAAAEDALADAFEAALHSWTVSGVPEKPEAWLLTTARRRLIDRARHDRVREQALPELLLFADEAHEVALNEANFPDERLKLMFVCAHPAIPAEARAPLMLQTVLGLDAARIASAFLVPPSTMGQRLSRVKAKIRATRMTFDVPEVKELPERIGAVLDAIYVAYGSGWEDVAGADDGRLGLADEAIVLARLLLRLLPHPETQGLLALMLHCESRRAARRDPSGDYVPLSQQDVGLWSLPMIYDAERLLAAALEVGPIGRYQLEAAIQSAHSRRARAGRTDWHAIVLLYEGLGRIAPTIGASVAHAAAVAETRGAEAAWKVLAPLPQEAVQTYQPYWALAAHLHALAGEFARSDMAYDRAIGLSGDSAIRRYLLRSRASVRGGR